MEDGGENGIGEIPRKSRRPNCSGKSSRGVKSTGLDADSNRHRSLLDERYQVRVTFGSPHRSASGAWAYLAHSSSATIPVYHEPPCSKRCSSIQRIGRGGLSYSTERHQHITPRNAKLEPGGPSISLVAMCGSGFRNHFQNDVGSVVGRAGCDQRLHQLLELALHLIQRVAVP